MSLVPENISSFDVQSVTTRACIDPNKGLKPFHFFSLLKLWFGHFCGCLFCIQILSIDRIISRSIDEFGLCCLAGSSALGSTGSETVFSSLSNNLLWSSVSLRFCFYNFSFQIQDSYEDFDLLLCIFFRCPRPHYHPCSILLYFMLLNWNIRSITLILVVNTFLLFPAFKVCKLNEDQCQGGVAFLAFRLCFNDCYYDSISKSNVGMV